MSTTARHPPGIPYIIANEGCERFSFYGMRAILTEHMVLLYAGMGLSADAAKAAATSDYHLFTAAAYALPMVGAILADRLLGKYRVILWLSLVYCLGHAALAVGEDSVSGMHIGLGLIAIGSGGIKPCVSANVGDQYGAGQEKLVAQIFSAFYFIINFGSFFATLLIPWLNRRYGPSIAFGIPGVLMLLATLVFWAGKNRFVRVPPSPGGRLGLYDAASSVLLFASLGSLWFTATLPVLARVAVSLACVGAGIWVFVLRSRIARDRGMLTVLWSAFVARRRGQGGWSGATAELGEDTVAATRSVLSLLSIFALVAVFWALFDQRGSSWVVQAKAMDRHVTLPFLGALELEASQINALNPMLVMLLIPLVSGVFFPWLDRRGVRVSPMQKMTAGMLVSALSFAWVALLQAQVEASPPQSVHVAWQLGPFTLITLGEVLVSVTGLEFAYTQAPKWMKSTVVGLWSLSVTLGNLLVALLAGFKGLPLVSFFWVFAGLMLLAAGVFWLRVRHVQVRAVLQ